MKIVIAPDSFKESADAVTVAGAIARGVRRALPEATLDLCPMADGGQGTVAAMVAAAGRTTRTVTVAGPLDEPVDAAFGLLPNGRTAVVEMAAASGLMLAPPARRDPLATTTYGTGQLIIAALGTLPAEGGRIIVGVGGSATNDGGAGMAQAIGVRFYDRAGRPIERHLAGGSLVRIARIDASPRDRRLGVAEIVIACDVDNPFVGPNGASAVYGPQKGATPEMVAALDANMAHLARVIERDLGVRIADLPGAGAAGGLGGGLIAFCGGTTRPGVQIVADATGLADRLRGADLCITGEGRLDAQSLAGKTAIGIARLARSLGVPTIAFVGSVGDGAAAALAAGLASYHVVTPPALSRAEAFARVEELIEAAVAQVMRHC